MEGEKKGLENVLNDTEPLANYWLIALKNSIAKDLMKDVDDKIMANLTDIQTNVSTDTIEIILSFRDNEYLPACTLKRLLRL